MAYSEEIVVKMGIDSKAMQTGLKSATTQVKDFKDSTISALRDVKREIKGLKLVFGGGGAIALGMKVYESIKDFWIPWITGASKAEGATKKWTEALHESHKALQDLERERDRHDKLLKNLELENASPQGKVEVLERWRGSVKAKKDDFVKNNGEDEYAFMNPKLGVVVPDTKKQGDFKKERLKYENEILELDIEIAKAKKAADDDEGHRFEHLADQKKKDEEERLRREQKRIKEEIAHQKAVTAEIAKQLSLMARSTGFHNKVDESDKEKSGFTVKELANMDPKKLKKGSGIWNDHFDAQEITGLEEFDAKNPNATPEERKAAVAEARRLRLGLENAKPSEQDPGGMDRQMQEADVQAGVGAQGFALSKVMGFDPMKKTDPTLDNLKLLNQKIQDLLEFQKTGTQNVNVINE